jgi:hypothetical protein
LQACLITPGAGIGMEWLGVIKPALPREQPEQI